jgi:hypothetical protein
VTRYERATMAEVQRAMSDEIARLTARTDQLAAARRDALTPVANIPKEEHDAHFLPPV